jgi:hypothetical protein
LFANRFTAFVDACVLADTLKRNLLLTLAEAEFFRIRWSEPVLQEAEAAIEDILCKRGFVDAAARAAKSRSSMQAAFEEAMVIGFERFLPLAGSLPDMNDTHVLAAAVRAQASILVTDNLKHFPATALDPLNIEVRSADDFIADTIALDEGRAVTSIKRMRERFSRPSQTAEQLLLDMAARGLLETSAILRSYVELL